MSTEKQEAAFVVYGKTGDGDRYSVRTKDGKAICTCAYNPGREDREALAQLIADALNAYAAALQGATT